ncbi:MULTISPECIES: glutamate--tRNA ligase [Rhodomicrobium]|uniref:glutamate--tRNA ligase n=1 Tax=Rhodomicrobium TaxID=1068 RepID=UPI000B4B6993|nr:MULTISPECIES: glutamate--tRNA ligase [Rhodomicrobium]
MPGKVVTRFAPSPTGFLHIGGARTALFNWLYAKATGGQFLLRIEDTDRTRSTDAAVEAILDGLRWLELNWDGEPVFQFARMDRHAEIARQLLAEGKAYRCYATPEELEAMREKARAEGRSPVYDGRWRDRDPSEAPKDAPFAVRFKAPNEGETVVDDKVQGRVTFPNKDLDDLIILRSDGTPTYNLSVVVDDHDMGVTHIIRGDDHLTNAARQSQIYAALGWDIPVFGHIPLIHGPDGAKMSKRHGALGVGAYREMGYLPAAMRNYLARLGWSHGDDEIFSTAQMIEWFGTDALGKSPSRFDFAKLENLNGHYIRAASDAELIAALRDLLPHLPADKSLPANLSDEDWRRLELAMPGLKERAKTLVELIDGARFLFAKRPLKIEEKAAKLLNPEARARLAAFHDSLLGLNDWSAAGIEAAARAQAEALGIKLGDLAQPLRAALTGRTVSPGIFDVLFVLGREEALGRIEDQAAPVKTAE